MSLRKHLSLVVLCLSSVSPVFADDIRDVKPPMAFPGNPIPWFLLVILIVLFLFVAGQWYLRNKKNRGSKVPPAPLSWDAAYDRLRQLRQQNFPAQGKIKEYYTQLSDIIRRYIEDRFTIRAPEMTTEEFLFSLRTSADLSAQHKAALQDFLNCCDMVKFARYDSNAQEIELSFQMAERFITETKLTSSAVMP